VQRSTRICAALLLLWSGACRSAKSGGPPPDAALPLLSVFAGQRMIVTPTATVRAADSLGWVRQLAGAREAARRLDTSIVAALDARGLASRWILPPELVRAYERNRTYAADPHALIVDQVRSARFKTGDRYGEPLSSQLRTMIALHEDTRFVLLPVELRFERQGAAGRAVLRLALLDPRSAEAKWIGEVKGDAAGTAALAMASLATRFADLFVAP
jgi:hypothetical protein